MEVGVGVGVEAEVCCKRGYVVACGEPRSRRHGAGTVPDRAQARLTLLHCVMPSTCTIPPPPHTHTSRPTTPGHAHVPHSLAAGIDVEGVGAAVVSGVVPQRRQQQRQAVLGALENPPRPGPPTDLQRRGGGGGR